MNDYWSDYKKAGQEKRRRNAEWSINHLKSLGIKFTLLNENTFHYRVGEFDFWPSTGVFYNQKTKEKGRGIKNLIKKLR